MTHAILQDPKTGKTSLTTNVTAANFPRVVYRPGEAGARIVREGDTYVEIAANRRDRKVLSKARD